MPNLASIISSHNKMLLRPHTTDENKHPPCNCRNKNECPLDGECRESFVIYTATLSSTNSPEKVYYGGTKKEFKTRYYNHKQSFKHKRNKHATVLSKAVWEAKKRGDTPAIIWEVHQRAPTYQHGAKQCALCLTEKLAIISVRPHSLLKQTIRNHREMQTKS